jgi:glycosyltransferase involved in cell wall biosynthesis
VIFKRGIAMRVACEKNVPVRLMHTHLSAPSNALRQVRATLRRKMMLRSGIWNAGLAVSPLSGFRTFGYGWQNEPRFRLLMTGIDTDLFRAPVDRHTMRAKLGLPDDAIVFGTVSRASPEKNQLYLLEVLAELVRQDPRYRLLWIGGAGRHSTYRALIEKRIDDLGLRSRIIDAGLRDDVPDLMRGAMDLFLFTPLWEPAGRVIVEAQAAGLPVVVSEGVTDLMDVAPSLVTRLSLAQPPSEWAQAVQTALDKGPAMTPAEALDRVSRSAFEIRTTVRQLEGFYDECIAAV